MKSWNRSDCDFTRKDHPQLERLLSSPTAKIPLQLYHHHHHHLGDHYWRHHQLPTEGWLRRKNTTNEVLLVSEFTPTKSISEKGKIEAKNKSRI
jgi:hypothetical protein